MTNSQFPPLPTCAWRQRSGGGERAGAPFAVAAARALGTVVGADWEAEYRDAMRHRQAAVADSRLIRLAPLTTGAAFNDPED